MMKVYHIRESVLRDREVRVAVSFGGKYPEFNLQNYEMVALVETDDIDRAYRLTNHIDQNWGENPGVWVRYGAKNRSTSMGDVIADMQNDAFYCDMVGWKKVGSNSE